jgi:hypothetical protein
MQALSSKMVRIVVLWVALLGAIALAAGRSAVVLASTEPQTLIVCSGFCNDQTDCTNTGCYCEHPDEGGTCRPLQ